MEILANGSAPRNAVQSSFKSGTKILAFAQDSQPRKTRLGCLQTDALKRALFIADRPAPFSVVVVTQQSVRRRPYRTNDPIVAGDKRLTHSKAIPHGENRKMSAGLTLFDDSQPILAKTEFRSSEMVLCLNPRETANAALAKENSPYAHSAVSRRVA